MNHWKQPTRPYSIAHRGASAYAPEGSLEAYQKAARLGADFWEVDIRLASCKTLICCHDPDLPDGRAVADLTARTLSDINAAIPLADVLVQAASAGAGIYADIKDRNATLPTLAALKSHGIERAILGSFDQDANRMLGDADCPYLRSVLVPPGMDPFSHELDTEIIHLCWENMERPEQLLDDALFAEARNRGYKIAIWHEDDPSRMKTLRQLPVFGICSPRPEMIHPFRPPTSWPVNIVCHRGAKEFAPENTLAAAHCGFAAGFPYVEIDVRSTRDGTLVVIHDETLERTTNGSGSVSWRTAEELRHLDAGSWKSPHFSSETVPDLGSFLDLTRRYGGNLYLELKSADPSAVVASVNEREMLPDCFFWSPDYPALAELRRVAPDARIMVRRHDAQSLDAALDYLAPEIIEFKVTDDWDEFSLCRAGGVQVMVAYTGRDTGIFDRMIDAAPDYLNLGFPFEFRDHLQRRIEVCQGEFRF